MDNFDDSFESFGDDDDDHDDKEEELMIQWNRTIPLQIMIQLQRNKKVFHKL